MNPLKPLQFVFKLCERQRSQGRLFMQAHSEDSKSCHEEVFGEEHVVKVTVPQN